MSSQELLPLISMALEYLSHDILLGYIALWTAGELVAARVWPVRTSCKKISLLHCIAAFLLSSTVIARRFASSTAPSGLCGFDLPGTLEHHVVSLSMAYFIVDLPFAVVFHRTFVLHHAICIVAFAAIQGYWKYLPENNPFFMDFMTWDTAPAASGQLLMAVTNGIFNLWMAELGGVFFHLNRALVDTDLELPSRGLFLLMFGFTRCLVWPAYLRRLYTEAAGGDATRFHTVAVVLETCLFATNLRFLYKNVAPVWRTGRLLPHKPRGFHRRWLDRHRVCRRVSGVFLRDNKLALSPSVADLAGAGAAAAGGDAARDGRERGGDDDAGGRKKEQ